ncbi:hypothetical protein HOLleu_10970 [Holothuria leucospilota]|uniref:Uncharacterized protein n=1 Tax=Holothuria leucospilota TaxID=206669 RepID=A0A9Q1HEV2_HOLLE|nr:hypothetical protein HOLleu_10970 [Holothuria leucospilota]
MDEIGESLFPSKADLRTIIKDHISEALSLPDFQEKLIESIRETLTDTISQNIHDAFQLELKAKQDQIDNLSGQLMALREQSEYLRNKTEE